MRILAADWILRPAMEPLRDGALLLEDTILREVGTRESIRSKAPQAAMEEYPGAALLPGLINCHTHLELAGLKRIPAKDGFSGWLRDLMAIKENLGEEGILEGAVMALACGTAYLADTATTLQGKEILSRAGLPATLFLEFLGLGPEGKERLLEAESLFNREGEIPVLPACHAPFSTSPDLFRQVAAWSEKHGCPRSVHLAESPDEVELLASGGGKLPEFLKSRGISNDLFPVPGTDPIRYLDDHDYLSERTLAVHLVQVADPGIALLKERNVKPVLCPSSNLHLLGRLPPIRKMVDAGLKPCLGTDSPASGASLNLFNEMEILLDQGLDENTVFEMATRNGADALHLSRDFGGMKEGASPYLLAIPLSREEDSPIKNVIQQGARGLVRWAAFPKKDEGRP